MKDRNLIPLITISFLLTGCAHQTIVAGNTDILTDTSLVTIQKGSAISYERYNDPLDYYHNGFDDLYFN